MASNALRTIVMAYKYVSEGDGNNICLLVYKIKN